MSPSQPMIRRSVRTIQSELDFLADSEIISQEQLATILSNLPDADNLSAPVRRGGGANAPQPATQPPASSFPNLNATDNNAPMKGYYAPSASPVPQSQIHGPPAYPQAPMPPMNALKYATAMYVYKPSDSYDLEMAPGDRIAVIEEMNVDWWKGRSERTGLEGIFPRTYVREEQPISGPYGEKTSYGNMPLEVATGQQQYQPQYNQPQPVVNAPPSQAHIQGKKFGKKLGNAAIFGAGATIGSNIVNSIF